MLDLNNLKPAKGAIKKKKRVGRGNASGHGTYSTRGLKGQKSRSGVSNLKRLGMRSMLLGLPKNRGFKSLKPKDQVVGLDEISLSYKVGMLVNPDTLKKAGLIEDKTKGVKILGNGELKIQKLHFAKVKVSESVKAQIEKTGGKVDLIPVKKKAKLVKRKK
jgi:large subunit ribosomal protein L15